MRLVPTLLAAAAFLASAQLPAQTPSPAAPAAPAIAAKSWLRHDVDSGQTLAASKPLERVEPASLT
jgi:D-alanyl-D-alanine carboxypeptidase